MMKRQVAILGPTPEFVRWSIRMPCLMRDDTDIASVDQTEKRLRSIRAAGQAIAEHRIVDGIAIELDATKHRLLDSDAADETMGFRLDEVFQPWGGQRRVFEVCGKCPANVLSQSPSTAATDVEIRIGFLAGCHGWLRRDKLGSRFDELCDDVWKKIVGTDTEGPDMVETKPRWYGLWNNKTLADKQLEIVHQLFNQVRQRLASDLATPEDDERLSELGNFCSVTKACIKNNLMIDVELVPPGFSDGIHWTIDPFCGVCGAARPHQEHCCSVCGVAGGVQPAVRRRVLGRRPYVPLSIVVGRERIPGLLERYGKEKAERD